MPTKLKNLVITKVALVDEGSCSVAHIKLYKRKEEGGTKMEFEDILKALPEDQRAVVQAEIEKAKTMMPEGALTAEEAKALAAEKATAETEKKAAMDEVENLKKQINGGQTDEEILKSANLDPAIKAILERNIAKSKAAEAQIKKMKEEQEQATFIAKAKEVSLIPEADTKVVDLLKSVNGVEGAVDKVMDILNAANAIIAKGKTFTEFGTTGTQGVDNAAEQAWAAIEKAADELVMKGTVSKAKAIEIVTANRPELYNAYVNALRNE